MKLPPKHLSEKAKKLWKKLLSEYQIDDTAGLSILQAGLEAYDRAEAARVQIEADGLTILDKFNQTKPHPLIACERDSRAAFLHAMRMLNFDLEPKHDRPGRPPGR